MEFEFFKNWLRRLRDSGNLVPFGLVAWIPYFWLVLFFLIPFAIIVGISFSEGVIAIPPYKPLWSWVNSETLEIRLSLSNYLFILGDHLYLTAYINSLWVAFFTTVVCLMIGYPMAYGITRAPEKWKLPLLMLVILPFWTSFLVRVYAWMGLLSDQGFVNHLLIHLGWIKTPLPLMDNFFSVGLGIVYAYLPFMILPLYAALEKIDLTLVEAASDLGCQPIRAFWKVVVPLSFRGTLGGAMLVFIPAVGEFVIPELLGGSKILMIGKVLWNEFFYNRDWPVASGLAVLMVLLLLLPMVIFQKIQNRGSSDNL
jgi:putrescine transport system permease protein